MYQVHQTSFQTETPLFAFRSFIANGRRFNRGEDFPWKEMGLSAEKVANLFKSKLVKHREVAVKPVVADVTPMDDLDAITDMKELRAMADELGAPYKVSKSDQRQAIREARGE